MVALEFLRRMMHFIGGRVAARLAPRLLFFQYSNIITNQLDQKNKKWRFYQLRTAAQMEIYRLKMRHFHMEDTGLSTLKDHESDSTEASIFDVHNQEDLSDAMTVYSSYFQDDRSNDFQFIELDRSIVQDI